MRVSTLVWAAALAQSAAAAPFAAKGSWPGWQGVKYIFSFGDSYTQTGFNNTQTQPNAANPMGNPAYPGWTSSNGPNWIDFLTTTYNKSRIFTYNLAYGGATVDSDLVKPYLPTVLSLKDQVNQEWIPTYKAPSSISPWSSHNTLFTFFFGINDVGNSWWLDYQTLYAKIFAEYSRNVELLYAGGAKNFLFLNVPPVDRSPMMIAQGASANQEKPVIQYFNDKIEEMAMNLTQTHPDATVFVFDTNALFSEALDNPKAFPQTAGVKNTTAYCDAYQNGAAAWDTLTPSCGIPVNQYFWLNSLHPTYPMHNATAAHIAMFLQNGSMAGMGMGMEGGTHKKHVSRSLRNKWVKPFADKFKPSTQQ